MGFDYRGGGAPPNYSIAEFKKMGLYVLELGKIKRFCDWGEPDQAVTQWMLAKIERRFSKNRRQESLFG